MAAVSLWFWGHATCNGAWGKLEREAKHVTAGMLRRWLS